jgi:DNA replication ATP-dependent helicase Dna2
MTPAHPISYESAIDFYDTVYAYCKSSASKSRETMNALRSFLHSLYSECTKNELQFFSTTASLQSYCLDRYNIDKQLADRLNSVRIQSGKVNRDSTLYVSTDSTIASLYVCSQAIEALSGVPLPNGLQRFFDTTPLSYLPDVFSEPAERIPFVRCLIISWIQDSVSGQLKLKTQTDTFGIVTIELHSEHSALYSCIWEGATLHITSLEKNDTSGLYKTTKSSLIVVEPDILFDVTSIAECFQKDGSEPLLYLLNKLSPSDTSLAIAKGSLVNQSLDILLSNPSAETQDVFNQSWRSKPLSIIAGIGGESEQWRTVEIDVAEQIERLKDIINQLDYDKISTEPSFISPIYGLQGRLDVMLEYNEEPSRKTIIELKSGSAPSPTRLTGLESRITAGGMWVNHLIQVACYTLLLESAFDNRTGDSQILYSKTSDYPLRNALITTKHKYEALMLRNRIVAIEQKLLKRQFGVFKSLIDTAPKIPDFKQSALDFFANSYKNFSELERVYFLALYSFTLREQYIQRIGNESNQQGFASLWRKSVNEKNEELSILAYITLNYEQSDWDSMYLYFDFSTRTATASVFRVGDIVVLYPTSDNGKSIPYKQQIIKATVVSISDSNVVISLRNKQLHQSFFQGESNSNSYWVLEPDYIESSVSSINSGILRLLSLPDESRKNIFLGIEPPRLEQIDYESKPALTDEQNQLVQKALSSKDYFLLQGPPGTGKTSTVLRTLVEELYKIPNEIIFVIAYTNRAVDEICSALKRSPESIDFMRFGSKQNTTHHDILFSTIADTLTPVELYKKVQSTKVVVSTISFLHANTELFTLTSCTTAIIDEASQILEPLIASLVPNCRRMILIGDEKQLPAVVVQQERSTLVSHEELAKVRMFDLRVSYFERLLRICKSNQWESGYGMLTRQARMHADIQFIPNNLFYQNKLIPMLDWQRTKQNISSFPTYSIGTNTQSFIPVGKSVTAKVSEEEARICAELVISIYQQLGAEFDSNSVGIITPFRSQIREIHNALPDYLRPLITVDTVERYQGSERDCIIISTAVNHTRLLPSIQSLSVFDDVQVDRKLNVALTRARKQCIVVGCEEVLIASPHYRAYIEHCYSLQESDTLPSR